MNGVLTLDSVLPQCSAMSPGYVVQRMGAPPRSRGDRSRPAGIHAVRCENAAIVPFDNEAGSLKQPHHTVNGVSAAFNPLPVDHGCLAVTHGERLCWHPLELVLRGPAWPVPVDELAQLVKLKVLCVGRRIILETFDLLI